MPGARTQAQAGIGRNVFYDSASSFNVARTAADGGRLRAGSPGRIQIVGRDRMKEVLEIQLEEEMTRRVLGCIRHKLRDHEAQSLTALALQFARVG